MGDNPNEKVEVSQMGLDEVVDQRNRVVAMDIACPDCSGLRDQLVTTLDMLMQVLKIFFPIFLVEVFQACNTGYLNTRPYSVKEY